MTDIEGSFLSFSSLKSLTTLSGDSHRPVLLVGNKTDLLPANVRERAAGHSGRVHQWLRSFSHSRGLEVSGVSLTSALRDQGTRILSRRLQAMVRHEREKRFFVVGCTNVGKSTLINQQSTSASATTSSLPGTTLGLIWVQTLYGLDLYDTPGLSFNSRIADGSLPEFQKALQSPKKPMREECVHLKVGDSILLGALAQVDYVKGPTLWASVFVASTVTVHRCKTIKGESLRVSHAGEMLKPKLERVELPPCVVLDPKAETHHNAFSEIAIAGLGWKSFCAEPLHNEPAHIRFPVRLPKGTRTSIREPLVLCPSEAMRKLGLM